MIPTNNNISIFKNFIQQYQSTTGASSGAPVSTKHNASAPPTNSGSGQIVSTPNTINQPMGKNTGIRNSTNYHHPTHSEDQHPTRSQTSQAIKSFDGNSHHNHHHHHHPPTQNVVRNTSSGTYQHAKAFLSSSTNNSVDPTRRKVGMHVSSANHQN